MEKLEKLPDGYISIGELIELSERSLNTVRTRLKCAGVKGKSILLRPHVRILIYPQREALYAALDK